MKVGLYKSTSLQRRLYALALFMGIASVLLLLMLPAGLQPHCRFHEITGQPCPGCGATRCLSLLMGGHPLEAARMQPLLFLGTLFLAPALAYLLPALLLDWPLPRIRIENRRERLGLLAGAIMIILLNWGYLLFQHT